MAIHIRQGKPGGGKSYGSARKFVQLLRTTNKNIVTNLPLRMARLNEWLQQTFPDEKIDVLGRVKILKDEHLAVFWKFRGPNDPDHQMPELAPIEPSKPLLPGMTPSQVRAVLVDQEREQQQWEDRHKVLQKIPQSTEGKQGVIYIIDEAHIPFSSRGWMATGKGALIYLSQHRHQGDTVIAITQHCKNLDGQFTRLAEDFTDHVNEAVKMFGPFRGRDRFVAKTYYTVPDGKSEPFLVETYSLDPLGIGSIYDTAKGVGLGTSQADLGRKAKGWSIWWVVPLAFALVSLVGLVPWGLGKLAGSYVGGTAQPKKKEETAKPPPSQASQPSTQPPKQVFFDSQGRPIPQAGVYGVAPADTEPQKPLYATGIAIKGRQVRVYLSDGRTITETDGTLKRVEKTFAEFKDGSRVWLKARPPNLQQQQTIYQQPQPMQQNRQTEKAEYVPTVFNTPQPEPERKIGDDFDFSNKTVPRGTYKRK